MNESSLLNEYQKLTPGVKKIFVLPQIPLINTNTSYLFQLYKEFLIKVSPVKVVSFNASSLPIIFLSRLKAEKSILHYHWFEFEDLISFVGIKWKLFWIILYKLFGGKMIWTIHNYYPHHEKYLFLNKKFRRVMAKLADRLHIHCENEIDPVSEILNVEKKKFFIVKHPDFPSEIFEREEAIKKLNEKYFMNLLKADDKIFLMFGAIAEYKGIKEVIEIFYNLNVRNKLVVAGFIKKGNLKYYNEIKSLADNKKIFVEGGVIPDEDVPYFLNSADYCIFNYSHILTSGGVQLSLNYNKPVVVPFSGCLKILSGELIHFFKVNESRKDNLKKLLINLSGK